MHIFEWFYGIVLCPVLLVLIEEIKKVNLLPDAVRALLHFVEMSADIRELAIVQGLDVSALPGNDARKLNERLKA